MERPLGCAHQVFDERSERKQRNQGKLRVLLKSTSPEPVQRLRPRRKARRFRFRCKLGGLARELCKDDQVRSYFNERILFLTVSQSPDVNQLKANIVQFIMGNQILSPNSVLPQWNLQYEWTTVSKTLVVLDDVWSLAVLEPLLFKIPGCKFLVVSRFKFPTVLNATYDVELLREEEALSLFCHSAFGQKSIPPAADKNLVKQDRAAFIFCVEDRALVCQDCDESIHSANSRSANHQRFLATGIRVALSTGCSNDTEPSSLEPPSSHCSHKIVSTKIPTPQPSAISSPWGVDDLLQLSDFEHSDKKESVELGKFGWIADMGVFGEEQFPQKAMAAVAEVPKLPVSQSTSFTSYTPAKLNYPYKKPRIEMLDDDDHFTVPDLG